MQGEPQSLLGLLFAYAKATLSSLTKKAASAELQYQQKAKEWCIISDFLCT